MPTLHFSEEEFERRQQAACLKMAEAGLDGLIPFRQESMYYLTGYDTSGYTMFQAMYLGADGRCALLTRTADRIQSRATSIVEDISLWSSKPTLVSSKKIISASPTFSSGQSPMRRK